MYDFNQVYKSNQKILQDYFAIMILVSELDIPSEICNK